MLGYLKAIYDWFAEIGRKFLQGIFDVIRRFKWFVVAFISAVLAPIKWLFELAKDLTAGLVNSSAEVLALVQSLRMNEAGGMWAALSDGAALMNCVVPLDVLLGSFGGLLTLWMVIFGIKAALFVYRHIPTVFGWGTNG